MGLCRFPPARTGGLSTSYPFADGNGTGIRSVDMQFGALIRAGHGESRSRLVALSESASESSEESDDHDSVIYLSQKLLSK